MTSRTPMVHFAALWLPLLLLLGGCETLQPNTQATGVPIGAPMPELIAAGWLNGDPPDAEQLQGKIVVIDCFASWCGPCALAAPELVEAYVTYRDQGVVFVGLSPEDATEIENVKGFADRHGMSWPIGYAAQPTMAPLGAEYLPTVIFVGRDGRLAGSIQGFVEGELAKKLAEMVAERKSEVGGRRSEAKK